MPKYTSYQLIKDLVSSLRPYKKNFFLGVFLRASSDIIWLFPAWAISEIITFASRYQSGESTAYFWYLTITVWIIAVYYSIAHDLAKYYIYPIAEKISMDIKLKALQHLFALDSVWHEKELSGNKMKRITNGGESMKKILVLFIDLFIESTISFIGVIIVLATIKWQLIFMFLGFFISYYFLSLYLTGKASKQEYKTNVELEKFEGVSFEALNNIATIKTLGLGQNILKIVAKSSQELMGVIKNKIFRFQIRAGVLNFYKEFVRQAFLVYAILLVFQGVLEVGIIALIFFYFRRIEESARELSQVQNDFIVAKMAMVRLHEIFSEKPHIELSGRKKFPQHWKKLSLQKINFSYHSHKVLSDFSLTIKRGQKIGIVGLSGGGKSTLFKLLLKLYDHYEGDIFFDGINLRDIKRTSYVQSIAVVPQETELFNLSLRDNIVISRDLKKTDEKALKRALQIAHVQDFLPKLPLGIDSLIGEKGIKLSGGERQRVGIARAIYKNPQILLLDEATSHLDLISEKKIQEALQQFLKDITAIVIAHRLSTIQEMDLILFMHNGKIAEQGTFQELLSKKGEFWKLYQKQVV